MHRRSQFDMPENPASARRHGSRSATNDLSDTNYGQTGPASSSPSTGSQPPANIHIDNGYAATPLAATGGEEDGRIARHAARAPRKPRGASLSAFEPLIGSCEAARLLGNIHVKTLQRYARQRSLPGYQIGGHWYFRVSELDSWLRSRLNSSCHPCRLPKEAK
jgi:excisionase family DNA binding protein